MKRYAFMLGIILVLALSMSLSSAVSVKSVDASSFTPGSTGSVKVRVENNLGYSVDSVAFSLQLSNLPFTPSGSSQESVDTLDDGDDELFSFLIKAANDIKAGDYQIPYVITYIDNGVLKQVTGTIGVTVEANANLVVTLSTENAIVGNQGKLTLKIVNKGFADARFVTVTLNPRGFTLLSENEVYIGTIDSDNFDTATFDVIFKQANPIVTADVEFIDFDNKKIIDSVTLPSTVYTQEKAKELGITKQSYVGFYILIILVIIVGWFIFRAIRKRQRLQRSMQSR